MNTPESRAKVSAAVGDQLLHVDLPLIETMGCSDATFGILAGEHFNRTVSLLRCCDDTFARNMQLMLSKMLISEAGDSDKRISNPAVPD